MQVARQAILIALTSALTLGVIPTDRIFWTSTSGSAKPGPQEGTTFTPTQASTENPKKTKMRKAPLRKNPNPPPRRPPFGTMIRRS
jgi:hypothetical protein